MTDMSTSTAFWQAFWSLFDAAIAHGVDPSVFTPCAAEGGKTRPSPSGVMAFAAEFYDISMVELCGQRRDQHAVEARALAAWGLRRAGTPWSLTAIGRAMGGRDHTTIINLVRRADHFREASPRFAGACADLKARFHLAEEKTPCLQH